jgi:hypothetical protein
MIGGKSREKVDAENAQSAAAERRKGLMKTLKTIGWISVGLGAVAAGLLAGRELQKRYKFNRRTPYDYYAHAGDEVADVEFGVGV